MIIVELMGGMGNLMFQYAYGRALSIKNNEKLIFNRQFMNVICLYAFKRTNTNNALRHFNTPKLKYMNVLNGYFSSIFYALYFAILRKNNFLSGAENYNKLSKKGFFFTNDYLSFYEYSGSARKKRLIGGFNSFQYFKDIENIIRHELKVITAPSSENLTVINEISQNNSVCVHLRRGDYISNPKNEKFNVCDESYYKKGMKYIADKIKNPVFYIFSDNIKEIDYIKNNYKFNYNIQYIELNNPDYEELRLMYNCKHFIISNSTFSWWGSFLSENNEKIVIAPKEWVKNYYMKQDIYREEMILL